MASMGTSTVSHEAATMEGQAMAKTLGLRLDTVSFGSAPAKRLPPLVSPPHERRALSARAAPRPSSRLSSRSSMCTPTPRLCFGQFSVSGCDTPDGACSISTTASFTDQVLPNLEMKGIGQGHAKTAPVLPNLEMKGIGQGHAKTVPVLPSFKRSARSNSLRARISEASAANNFEVVVGAEFLEPPTDARGPRRPSVERPVGRARRPTPLLASLAAA